VFSLQYKWLLSLKKHKLKILNNEKVAVLAFSSLQTEQEV
jgi:hypothetical protein